MAVAPIKPNDVVEKKTRLIPDEVIETFNELIGRNFSEGSATVNQEDVVAALVSKGHTRQEIFDQQWLDVEEVYRQAGWNVQYDKPGGGLTGPPTFTFSKREYRR